VIANFNSGNRDHGFTLTELLIVIAMVGIVSVTIGAVFTVVVRTNPSSQARTDDSRSLLSLTNWISQDVASTAEDGFDVGNTATACLAATVPTSTGLLQLRWSEASTNYVVNYRYRSDGVGAGTGSIYRYSCKSGQTASALKLTPTLEDMSAAALAPAPARITLVPTTMASGAAGNKGLQLEVFVLDEFGVQRELLSLDATTSNVKGVLPPISGGGGSTNQPPQAGPGVTSAVAGVLTTYDVPASDPEGSALNLSFAGLPAGWIVTAAGITASITPAASTTTGSYTFDYTVADSVSPYATASSTLTVAVTQPIVVNQPPIVGTATTTATKGIPVTVSLTASDPESEVITLAITNLPSGWTQTNTRTGPGFNVTITPSPTATLTTVLNVNVTDSYGNITPSTITVSVCTVQILSINPATVRVKSSNNQLFDNVDVTIQTNGACSALVLAYTPTTPGSTELTVAYNAGTVAQIKKSVGSWKYPAIAQTIPVPLTIRQGSGSVEATGSFGTTQ
jgi:prepilin-type N-terminal cleavage/methylation domain-containing protein